MKFISILLIILSSSLSYSASKSKKNLRVIDLDINSDSQIGRCIGGGFIFESNYFSLSHQFKTIRETDQCTPIKQTKNDSAEGKKYRNKKNEIDALVNKMLKNSKCIFVKDLLESYKRELVELEVYHKKNIHFLSRKMGNYFESTDIQGKYPVWAWISAVCNSSYVTIQATILFELLKYLYDLRALAKVSKVTKNKSIVESCLNVHVAGNEDLKEFDVKLKDAKDPELYITYNTFDVSDQIKVLADDGANLFDSGCVGTKLTKTDFFKIEKKNDNSRIKIRINANCDQNAKTAWMLRLTCRGAPLTKACQNDIKKLQNDIRKILGYTPPVLDKFWNKAICFENLYSKISKIFNSNDKLLQVVKNSNCQQYKSCDLSDKSAKKPEGKSLFAIKRKSKSHNLQTSLRLSSRVSSRNKANKNANEINKLSSQTIPKKEQIMNKQQFSAFMKNRYRKYKISPGDTIFQIVTKTYFKAFYPQLLY